MVFEHCPYCGSDDIEHIFPKYEPEETRGLDQIEIAERFGDYWRCNSCEMTWTEEEEF